MRPRIVYQCISISMCEECVGARASNIKPMFLPAGLTNPKRISLDKSPKGGVGGRASRHPPYAQWAPKDPNAARDGIQDGPIWLPRWPR